MNWYKFSKSESFDNDFDKKSKEFIKNDPFCQKLFNEYCIPIEYIDQIKIVAKPLKKQYGRSDGEQIIINKKIVDEDFFNDSFKLSFLIHELTHVLTRIKEKSCYFADKEEHFSFINSILFELLNGKNEEEIKKEFLPIISAHFKNEKNSLKFYNALLQKAYLRKQKYENHI